MHKSAFILYRFLITLVLCIPSQFVIAGGNGWKVKVISVTPPTNNETLVLFQSLDGHFTPKDQSCSTMTVHIQPRGPVWLLSLPGVSHLEIWLFKQNFRLSPNPIPIGLTLDALEQLKQKAASGETVDFLILSSHLIPSMPCHVVVRGIMELSKVYAPTKIEASLTIVAAFSYF